MLCITNNSISHQSLIYTVLDVETVLFQATNFSISTYFSFIWPIHRALSDAATAGWSGRGSDDNEWFFRITQNLQHYWNISIRLFNVISKSLVEGVSSLCREAVGVFYSPSGLGHRKLVEGVLPIWREAVGIFYNPNGLGHRKFVEGVLPLCREAVGVFYSPSGLSHRKLVEGVLPIWREAVGIFYNPSGLDHRILVRGI